MLPGQTERTCTIWGFHINDTSYDSVKYANDLATYLNDSGVPVDPSKIDISAIDTDGNGVLFVSVTICVSRSIRAYEISEALQALEPGPLAGVFGAAENSVTDPNCGIIDTDAEQGGDYSGQGGSAYDPPVSGIR